MKKTMVRIFAAVLVLAMAIGFLAMIPASATAIDETATVQFVSHNVLFTDYLQIMYAVSIPENTTLEKIVLTDGAKEFTAIPYLDENEQQIYADVDGASYPAYVASAGVCLQSIDTVVTAKAYVGGNIVATDNYSVLEYLHKRLVVDNASEAQDNMYTSLLAAAEAMQIALPNCTETLHDTSYVNVVNGTIDDNDSDGMIPVGSNLETVATELSPSATQEIEWTVTEYNDAGVVGETYKTTAIEDVVVEAGVNLVLSAELKDKDVTEVDYSGRYYIATIRSSGNYFYMTSDLGTASTQRYQAVDSGLSELPEKITGVSDGYEFVLEANEDGTYYIYAESSASANYLGWSSGNSGILVEKDNALKLTVDKTEEGLYNIHFTGDEERYLSLNGTTNNNYFAWYAGTQRQDLALIPIEECDHTYNDGVVTAPTCTEVGYTSYTCSKCGFVTKGDEVTATGHLNTETMAAVEATCQEKGYTEGTYCNDCNTYVDGHEEIATVDCVYVDGVCKWCGETESSGGEQTKDPKWVLVTDVSKIKDGDKILIVNTANSKAMSTTQNSNNRGAASVTIEDGMISEVGADVQQITLVQNGTNWNLMTDEGQYLYAASTSKNYLKTSSNNTNDNAIWSITIESDGVATIKANQDARNWMRFNLNSGNNIFSCYTSGQLDVVIFVLTTDY